MGFDCSLHLVDEHAIRAELVPRLLAADDTGVVPTPFDRRRPDAARRIARARKQLRGRDGELAARRLSELTILYASCALPFESVRGIALSLWGEGLHPDLDPDLPQHLLASPEVLFEPIVAAHPRLKGRFPTGFDGNGCPGVFVPARHVPALSQWTADQVERLDPGEQAALASLLRVLQVAAERGYAYWEGTDLEVDVHATLELGWLNPSAAGALPGVQPVRFDMEVQAGSGGSFVLSRAEDPRLSRIVDLVGTQAIGGFTSGRSTLRAARSRGGAWALVNFDRSAEEWTLEVVLPSADLPAVRVSTGRKGEPFGIPAWLDDEVILHGSSLFHHARPVDVLLDGVLRRAEGLPPLAFRHSRHRRSGGNGVLHTGGADLLLHDGHAYARRSGNHFEKVAHLDIDDYDVTSVPTSHGGCFVTSSRRLYEVHLGQPPIRHLAGIDNVMAVSGGPQGWILLKEGENARNDIGLAYRPEDGACRSISPNLIPDKVPDRSYMHWFRSLHWLPEANALGVVMGHTLWLLPWPLVLSQPPTVFKDRGPEHVVVQLESDDPRWAEVSECYRQTARTTLYIEWSALRGADPGRYSREYRLQPPRPAVVEFVITNDGSTRDAVVRESCGTEVFDKTARAVVTQPDLLRPLPPQVEAVAVRASFGALDAPRRAKR